MISADRRDAAPCLLSLLWYEGKHTELLSISGICYCHMLCAKAPPGVKKNLLRTFEAWSPEYVSKSGSVSRSQALFVLAWFHAIVQERRIFIPQVHTVSALLT